MTEYAHFVGRIGGLAAALGVGIALTAATPAVVHADTGNPSSPTNSSTNTSSPSGTTGTSNTNPPAETTSATTATPNHISSSATPAPGTTATPSGATELPSTNTTTATAPSGTPTPPAQPATTIHATSNGGSLNTAPQNTPPTPEVKPPTSVDPATATGATADTESVSAPTTPTEAPPTPSNAATPTPNALTAAEPPPSTTKNTSATGNSTLIAATLVQAPTNPIAATTPPTTSALTAQTLSSVSGSPTTSLNATSVVAKSTALTTTATQVTAQVSALAPAATTSTTMPSLISAVVTSIDGFLRNIVTAAMNLTGPGAPLDNPLAWTILAWTRRTFFNEPNNAATPAAVNATAIAVTPIVQEPVSISSPNASGAVTVNIVATDPLGRPITYWVLTPPAPATGAVTTNATPGEFTYTPTTDARVSAATGGPTTDTFTIAVAPTANPNAYTTITVTADVKPATGTLPYKGGVIPNDPDLDYISEVMNHDWTRTVVWEGTLSTTTDPAGIPVTYSVTTEPKYGEVDIDPTTGTWTYTPTVAAVNAMFVGLDVFLNDSFKTVDKLPDLSGTSAGPAAIVGDPENTHPAGDPELAQHVWVWDGDRWVDTGPYFTWDPFTITAHDPNASAALYPYSSVEIYPGLLKREQASYGIYNTGCSANDDCSAITPAPGGGGTGIAYVSAAGNKWIYSISEQPENGKVEISQTTSTFTDGKGYTYTGISTGTFTYTPNAALAASGGSDEFSITATDPVTGTTHETPVSVTVLANNAGSVWAERYNQIDPQTNTAVIGTASDAPAVTSKSGYSIGTGRPTPPPPPPPPPPPTPPAVPGGSSGGALPSVTTVAVAVAATCTDGVDGTPQDADVAPICVDQPIVSSPDNPHAGSPEATPAATNGPVHQPTANSDPSNAHTQTQPFDVIAWLETIIGIDLQQILPQPADSGDPSAPTPNPPNPTANPDALPAGASGPIDEPTGNPNPFDALVEGQPFDVIAWLETFLGLTLYDNRPGPTNPPAPANTPSAPLNAPIPTPGTP